MTGTSVRPAALAGHDEIPPHPVGTHRDGLQQPVLRDAGGKLSQCVMIKGLARLVRVWLNLPQGQRFDPGVSLKAGGGVLK